MGFGVARGFARKVAAFLGYPGEVLNFATAQEPSFYGSTAETPATITTTGTVTAT